MTTITSDLEAYRASGFSFLRSTLVKYNVSIDLINSGVQLKGYVVNDNDPTTWKYYLNAQGLYHESDTPMVVTSLDDGSQITLSPDILKSHVRTKNAYVPGSSYYDALCDHYPNQTDVIRGIFYPVEDVQAAIDADDLSIIAYGTSILEIDEEGYILDQLTVFLNYVKGRWQSDFMSSSPYFCPTFYLMVRQLMAGALFAARLRAIKSPYVNSWHIWQYLTSNGLGDYSDILDRARALFLYQNLQWLYDNAGKQKTLTAVSDYILKPVSVGLWGRSIRQQTLDGAADCVLIPEFVPERLPLDYATTDLDLSAETVEIMNLRLVASGAEINDTEEYVQEVTRQLGDTTYNYLQTKVVEIHPLQSDRWYALVYNTFIYDMLFYNVQNDFYNIYVDFVEPFSSDTYTVTTKEALVLIYYCLRKAVMDPPVNLPTHYTSQYAYSRTPTDDQVPNLFTLFECIISMREVVDRDDYLEGSFYPPGSFKSPQDFSDISSSMFLTLIKQIEYGRHTVDLAYAYILDTLRRSVQVKNTFALTLAQETDYETWFANHMSKLPDLLARSYETADDVPQAYADLADVIMTALVPTTEIMKQYANVTITSAGYDKIKRLLQQLTSWDIMFVDTDRDVDTPLYVDSNMGFFTPGTVSTVDECPITVTPHYDSETKGDEDESNSVLSAEEQSSTIKTFDDLVYSHEFDVEISSSDSLTVPIASAPDLNSFSMREEMDIGDAMVWELIIPEVITPDPQN